MNRKFALSLAFLSGMTFTYSVQAASFSCDAAKTKTELSICKNRSLNDADVKMVTTYQIVLHALPMGGRDSQKDTQQQWLKKRNACAANVSCISKAYQQRQQQLDSILQDRVLSHGPF
ncbi:lysozyme inhibitor LprI family protein [Acinetobacter sp. XH1741]|uniref:lysozyme inhibitor LprI family protein n=1 Tax=unclassified Acinetobacter TaxID=196816 RepID=UPI0032B3E264